MNFHGNEQETDDYEFVYFSRDILMCISHSPLVRAPNICLTSFNRMRRTMFSSFHANRIPSYASQMFTQQKNYTPIWLVKQTEIRNLYKQFTSIEVMSLVQRINIIVEFSFEYFVNV